MLDKRSKLLSQVNEEPDKESEETSPDKLDREVFTRKSLQPLRSNNSSADYTIECQVVDDESDQANLLTSQI